MLLRFTVKMFCLTSKQGVLFLLFSGAGGLSFSLVLLLGLGFPRIYGWVCRFRVMRVGVDGGDQMAGVKMVMEGVQARER
ncbi:hypothetical protein J1N35_020847 [Gossypium stocksii]|uniref:Transmembrane protein n=1 Tax=Gossypium stocksii TaxID=47602 RepID=A0A9D3VDE8_9ROSI|nr:hypothetical protein J1N35_020847 [Gossypium stocksii]